MGTTLPYDNDKKVYREGDYLDARRLYKIKKKLGEGSFGTVYKVQNMSFPNLKEYAVKVFNSENSNLIENETKNLQDLENSLGYCKNIKVPKIIYTTGENDNYIIIMEYIEGLTLEKYLREKKLTNLDSIKLILELLKTLKCIHNKGIKHRDIKPDNIIITNQMSAYLIDFGISKNLEFETSIDKEKGKYIGYAPYTPPEQKNLKFNELDEKSDIFSLGVVFYEMLTCKRPFNDNKDNNVEKIDNISPSLNELILKMIEIDRDKRFSSASKIIKKLEIEKELLSNDKFVFIKESDFLIGKYVVTNGEYLKFIKDKDYERPEIPLFAIKFNYKDFDTFVEYYKDFPVVNISYEDVLAYCDWLEKKSNLEVRLPTNKEWENVAKSGSQAKEYPWFSNKEQDGYANVRKSENDTIVDVYSYAVGDTDNGVRQMMGNVWEWTSTEDEFSNEMIVKGGSFNERAVNISYFNLKSKTKRYKDVGFRIIKKLKETNE